MDGINAKKVAKYMIMPGIIPRAKNLFTSGFGYVAFLMANIYNIVRLLPNNHPYLNPTNIGLYGIRHVIAEAANNVVLNKKNIDQIFVFLIMLAAVVLMCLQIAIIAYAYIIEPAIAGAYPQATSMFLTPEPMVAGPLTDIAYTLLDHVFGIPGLFCTGSLIPTCTAVTMPTPFHLALQSMFEFYSVGILLIGVIIFLYFIIVVIVETAATGTPFGQRFQNVWVPIRLVVALGLLVPLNYGISSGQYMTLFAAKYGSGFATNAWRRFNSTIAANTTTNNPLGEESTLIAKPMAPDISTLVQFMSLAHSCAYSHWKNLDGGSAASPVSTTPGLAPNGSAKIKPYLAKNVSPTTLDLRKKKEVDPAQTYVDALNFYDNGNILIVFGIDGTGDSKYNKFPGQIEPTCGQIQIPITDLSEKGNGSTVGGADQMQNYYFNMIKGMWYGTAPQSVGGGGGCGGNCALLINTTQRTTELNMYNAPHLQCDIGCGATLLPACTGSPKPCDLEPPSSEVKQTILDYYQVLLNSEIDIAWNRYSTNVGQGTIQDEMIDRGWGGAGIWFNDIATINGAFIESVTSVPKGIKYPMIMEAIRSMKCTEDSQCGGIDQFTFNSSLENELKTGLTGVAKGVKSMASGMNGVFLYWNQDGANQAREDKTITGNIFIDVMNFMFGTEGLLDMRGANSAVHPLAQLTAVGKGLVNSAIQNVAISTFSGFAGGPAAVTAKLPQLEPVADIVASFMVSTAIVGLTAGFVLFYVLPFLPFVYFYFAVGSWVKSIFEAMVGAPLWALAHLRLDGEGLPGDSASNGYFLIFEIFIRPILTVFGLIAALLIFTAQVRVLNFIWGLVVTNITGYEGDPAVAIIAEYTIPRGIVDQFFFTVIYTIIVYLLATSSFKLIETIPQNILRWMGAGVSSFSDINTDAKAELTRYVALGGLTVGQSAAQGVSDFGKGLGTASKMVLQQQAAPSPAAPPPAAPKT